MIYFLIFYWIVAGLAYRALPDPSGMNRSMPLLALLLSLIFGGILMPARLLVKLAS